MNLFLWYFIGAYSLKSIVKSVRFGKKIKRWGWANRGGCPWKKGRGSANLLTIEMYFQHFRWVEDQKVVERIVEIWPSIIKIMNHWISLPPSKQSKCKSYEVVKGSIKDPFTVGKLKIFSFIAGHLKVYLTTYQSQKPLIPFLYDDLQSLYKELLGLTIKSKVLGKCEDDYKKLLKIELREVKNHMKKKDMHAGFGTQQELLSILKKDCATHKDVNIFRINAREFLVTLLEKTLDKNSIPLNIVKYASVLDLKVLLS